MWVVWLILAFCVLVLFIARNHAFSMTHFKERPENYKPKNGLLSIVRMVFFGLNAYRSRITTTPAAYGWEYSTHELNSEEGIKLVGWYIKSSVGNGVVLLLNWFGGCKTDNIEAAGVFIELGYDVFLMDLRGHGDSSGMETSLGYDEYRDVLAGVEYIKSTFEPEQLIIYGVSLGAVATLRAFEAAEVTCVDALILEAPFDRLLNTIRHRVEAFKVPSLVFADILAIAGGILLRYNPYHFNPVDYAEEIGIPALVIHRDNDPYVSSGEVRNIYYKLKNKINSELITVSDYGHGTIVYSHPELFREEVEKFLSLVNK